LTKAHDIGGKVLKDSVPPREKKSLLTGTAISEEGKVGKIEEK